MRATVFFAAIMALCLLVIPMIAINFNTGPVAAEAQIHSPVMPAQPEWTAIETDNYPPEDTVNEVDGEFEAEMAAAPDGDADEEPAPASQSVDSFLILDESTGAVNEVSLLDFVRGAVAAEMPASFHSEALKAQAVAAHTFALHNHIVNQENPDPALKGADFSADPSNMKVYITEKTAREFYGEDADEYWDKICEAADSAVNYVLEYEDEPIVAAYHAISAGNTEDAANVWSGSAPYLVSVPSPGDLLAPGFESTVTLTSGEVEAMLLKAYPDIELGGGAESWFGEPARSSAGYVTEIKVGNTSLQGKDIREVFGLRSHDFKIDYSDGNFVFTVTGYGHGVGLSQYGADFLAKQGYTFDEILSSYYTGTTLKTINN